MYKLLTALSIAGVVSCTAIKSPSPRDQQSAVHHDATSTDLSIMLPTEKPLHIVPGTDIGFTIKYNNHVPLSETITSIRLYVCQQGRPDKEIPISGKFQQLEYLPSTTVIMHDLYSVLDRKQNCARFRVEVKTDKGVDYSELEVRLR